MREILFSTLGAVTGAPFWFFLVIMGLYTNVWGAMAWLGIFACVGTAFGLLTGCLWITEIEGEEPLKVAIRLTILPLGALLLVLLLSYLPGFAPFLFFGKAFLFLVVLCLVYWGGLGLIDLLINWIPWLKNDKAKTSWQ